MHLQEKTLGELGIKVIRNIAQYPLHYVTYAPAKFEVATANSLGGDTIIRNMKDMGGRTTMDRPWYEINIPFFLNKKGGISKSG